MKGLGLLTTAVFLFYGILHVDANANGAPPESCNKLDVLHFDPVESQRKGELTYYEPQKQSASVAELRSPYVIPILRTDSSTEYTASSILRVQLLRNPVYTNGDRVDFKGVIIQMRGDLDGTGQTYMPVGEFQLDDTIATNRQLGYDFSSSFKHLSCPICNVTKAFPELGSCPPGFAQNGDNTVTHTGNVGVTKSVTAQAGPTFMWTPKTDDGIWDPTRGYGRIQAQATVVKDEETFWVSLLSGRQTYENICINVNCGTNAICELLQGGLRTRCVCNPGFFGDDCQYHCIFQPPVCQHSGQCNLDLATRDTQPCSNCPNRATGPLCGSYINCPDAVLPAVLRNQNSGSTTVGWDTPVMVGFAVANPFYFYERDGGIPLSTAQVPGSNPPRTEAQFDFGRTTVTVTGTDGSLSVFCTFSVDVVDPCLPTNPCQNNGVCIGVTTTSFFCDCSNTGYQGDTCVVDACLGQCSATQQCIKDPVTGNFIRCADGCTPDPCNGNGACESGNGGFGFVCNCNPGWTGNTCSTPTGCNANPCEVLGTQTQICIPVGPTGFNCICDSDWIGTRCQFRDPCRANLGPAGVSNTCNPGQCIFNANEPYPFSPEFANFDCNCDNTGRTGPFCETSEICMSLNCLNGGVCQEVSPLVASCDCMNTGFMGLRCDVPKPTPACNPPCINGNCQQDANNNNVCVCQTGYTGPDCSILLCSPPCLNGGQCSLSNNVPICFCLPGFNGNDCSMPLQCNPTCVNGQCNVFSNPPSCICNTGYTGPACTILEACLSLNCQNGGVCQPLNGDPLVVTCNCDGTGFTGLACTDLLCSPPCLNGGQCSLSNNAPVCLCPTGYSGNDCSIPPQCIPSCVNGQCNVFNNPPNCICNAGYTGPACNILEACLSLNCQNGGVCQPLNGDPLVVTCNCDGTGFTGLACTDPLCTPPCQMGQCVPGPSCQCDPGYSGIDCSIPGGCNTSPCQNGGFCQPIGQSGYQCFCLNPFSGQNCEIRDECQTTFCQNGGTCNTDASGAFTTCTDCNIGYSGTLCEVFNPCTPTLHQCQNGVCLPNLGSVPPYICVCNAGGWHGQFCDRAPTGCADTPCNNGGVCTTVGTNEFQCDCINNYFGDTCEYRDICLFGNINCLNGGRCQSDPTTGVFVTCEPCNTGYSGTFCENDICNNNQCLNGLCIRTGSTTYSCQCNPGWLGQYCDQPLQAGCMPDPCLNGGVCTPVGTADYRCTCPDDYYGQRCETRDGCNSVTCENGGRCTVNPVTGAFMGCVDCDLGYSGLYCQLYVCDYQFCANGGRCIPLSASDYRCECPPQWIGQFCERPTACESPNPCENGGTCTATATGSFVCMCILSLWTGPTCEIPVACQPGGQNPCQNGGTCRPTSGSDYRCDCPPAWTGDYCQIAVVCLDPSKCRNGGTCTYDIYGVFTGCSCRPGYFGDSCELDGCFGSPCGDYGYCRAVNNQVGFICECFNFYSGPNCEIPPVCGVGFANDPCQPNGICEEDFSSARGYRCNCYPGYSGPQCLNEDACYNNPCQNGGQCTTDGLGSFTCECYSGYTGVYCQIRPVCGNNPCYNGGICIPNSDSVFEYDCNCIGPYTGQRCEILSGCNNNPCLNGGLCIPDENGGYRCNCVNDYTGRHCSIEPVCTTNPCYNGNCVPSNGVPTCICWDGYYGPYCDKRNECYNNNPCLNEGVCYFDEEDGRAKCDCTDLFSGYFCEIPNFRLCDINICLNGGTCWDEPDRGSVCTCINGYGGDLCEHIIISCEERYCDNGYCIEADFARGKTSRCRCNNGWYGEQCSERFENPCARGPCQNGGQCEYYSQYGGAYICKCAKGYSGKDCQNRGDIPRAAATRLQMVSLWTLITALGFYLLSRS